MAQDADRQVKAGRPRLSADGNTAVCVKVPDPLYDQVCARASASGISVPEVLRRALARDLDIQTGQARTDRGP